MGMMILKWKTSAEQKEQPLKTYKTTYLLAFKNDLAAIVNRTTTGQAIFHCSLYSF